MPIKMYMSNISQQQKTKTNIYLEIQIIKEKGFSKIGKCNPLPYIYSPKFISIFKCLFFFY